MRVPRKGTVSPNQSPMSHRADREVRRAKAMLLSLLARTGALAMVILGDRSASARGLIPCGTNLHVLLPICLPIITATSDGK